MQPPPNKSRRTRRRRAFLAAACIAVPVGGTGFAAWVDERFEARTERLRGTPVELRVQDGVSARELRAVRDGIVFADRFIERALRRRVRGPVEARVARSDRCRHDESGERSLIGQASAGFLCVDTANIEWKVLVSTDPPAAAAVSAHEYFHVLQSELGCLPTGDARIFRWLVEGMATDLAWRSLVRAGRASDADVRRTIRHDRPFDSSSKALRAYEREGGRPPQYAMWHLATRALVREARGPRALIGFCERLGRGTPWRVAFRRSFGVSVGDFYARFEAARAASGS